MITSGAILHRPSVDAPPTPVPGLFIAAGLPIAEGTAISYARRLNSQYTGFAVKVRRSNDNALADIGFDSEGLIDQSTLLAHCGANSGYVHTAYDQSGLGHNIITPLAVNQYRIVNAGVVETLGPNVCAVSPDSLRGGVSSPFTAYTGTDASVCVVGTLTSTANSQRVVSLLPSNTAQADHTATGWIPIARNQSTERWGSYRNGTWVNSADADYGELNQVLARVSGNLYSLSVDGTEVHQSLASTSFSVGRIAQSHTGTVPQSGAGQRICEFIVWFTALAATQATALLANQRSFYNTVPVVVEPPPASGDPATQGFTLKNKLDFAQGYNASDLVIYNFGRSTNNAMAWMSSEVATSERCHELGFMRLTARKNVGAKSFTYTQDGVVKTFYYQRQGGAFFWNLYKEEGLWRTVMRVNAPGSNFIGLGVCLLLWPRENRSLGDPFWPLSGEPDILELYPSNPNKQGGESNWHLDSRAGSGRAARQPPVAGLTGQYSGIPTNELPSGGTQKYKEIDGTPIDWRQWHTIDCILVLGKYIELVIDGRSHGRISHNAAVPTSSYVPYRPVARPYRLTTQTEGHFITDADSIDGPLDFDIKEMSYYALP